MSDLMRWILLPVATVGVNAAFAWFVCQMTACKIPCRVLKVADKSLAVLSVLCSAALVLSVVAAAENNIAENNVAENNVAVSRSAASSAGMSRAAVGSPSRALPTFADGTLLLFAGVGVVWGAVRIRRCRHYAGQMAASERRFLAAPTAEIPQWSGIAKWSSNHIRDLEVTCKEVVLSTLPSQLDGMTITHLSDLHIQNRMPVAFFRRVVHAVTELDSDIVVITGDFVDNCRIPSWVDDELPRLDDGKPIVYCLGNHDLLALDRVRWLLQEQDWHDCAEQPFVWSGLGERLVFFGDERPWLRSNLASRGEQSDETFAIAVCHSPDSWPRALKYGFPLTLAGHTHGGQVRLPGIGPIVAPSRYGTYFACGLFEQAGNWLHVSRGVFGTYPLRFRCYPEITQLTLRSP